MTGPDRGRVEEFEAEPDSFRLSVIEDVEESTDRSASASASGSLVITLCSELDLELGELLLFIAAAAVSNFASALWMVPGLGHRRSTSSADMTTRSLLLGVLVIDGKDGKDDKDFVASFVS